jgi:hypothetical protein
LQENKTDECYDYDDEYPVNEPSIVPDGFNHLKGLPGSELMQRIYSILLHQDRKYAVYQKESYSSREFNIMPGVIPNHTPGIKTCHDINLTMIAFCKCNLFSA